MRRARLMVLHGWGLPSGVMAEYISELSTHFQINSIELPGYGRNAYTRRLQDIEALATELAPRIKTPAILLGWSLGGMAALSLASCLGDRVRGVLLIASTPSFVNRSGWSHGVSQEAIRRMAEVVEQQPERTLREFAGLAAMGDAAPQAVLRKLKESLSESPADPTALADGLHILMSTDLREELANMGCPAGLLLGESDRLVCSGTAEACRELLPGLHVAIIGGAGHAPFLSRPKATVEKSVQLLEEMSSS